MGDTIEKFLLLIILNYQKLIHKNYSNIVNAYVRLKMFNF